MYEHFYGFTAKPFEESLDSGAFYLGDSQKKSLIAIHEGLKNGGGFIVVTGLAGIGKTALLAFLKREQKNSSLNIAGISAEKTNDLSLLPEIMSAFNQVIIDHSLPGLISQIESYIHSQIEHRKKPLLVVDEAHYLSYRSLEVLRLLSHFQSHGQPAFQVILVGDTKLDSMLSEQNHVALKEQIVSSTNMLPMELADTKKYVMHHLKRVGWLNKPIFEDDVFKKAQQETFGVAAKINQYFDHLLQLKMMNNSDFITPVMDHVANEKIKHSASEENNNSLNIDELLPGLIDQQTEKKSEESLVPDFLQNMSHGALQNDLQNTLQKDSHNTSPGTSEALSQGSSQSSSQSHSQSHSQSSSESSSESPSENPSSVSSLGSQQVSHHNTERAYNKKITMFDESYVSDFDNSGESDGNDMTLEETKRLFEDASSGTSTKTSGLNYKLISIVVVSYLLSAIVAIFFYYSEVAVADTVDSGVILAGYNIISFSIETNVFKG